MSDIFDMMEDDAGAQNATSVESKTLGKVAELAKAIRLKEQVLELLEQQAKDTRQELLKLTDQDLPGLMQELGLQSFTLDDGSKVEIKATYGGHIKVEDRPEAFSWLRDHGHGDIIKNTVSVLFASGEDSKASALLGELSSMGYAPEQKEDVHSSTLKAWVKERVELGEAFPMHLFGAWVGQRAAIKASKGK